MALTQHHPASAAHAVTHVGTNECGLANGFLGDRPLRCSLRWHLRTFSRTSRSVHPVGHLDGRLRDHRSTLVAPGRHRGERDAAKPVRVTRTWLTEFVPLLPKLTPNRRAILLATWGLFIGLSLLLVTAGIVSTLVGIRAELKQLPTLVSGSITTAYYAGFLIGSWYALRALAQVGHIRVYAALASLLSAAVLITGAYGSPIVWIAMRVITGLCFAGLYVVAESWLNGLATNTFRGRLLAIYNVVTIGAYGAGQLLVFNFDARTLTGFAFAAMVASLAVIPVAISEQATTPPLETHEHISMRELARIVPTGVGTILLVGLAHGGLLGMAVIFATREGLSTGHVGILVAGIQIGGMALTWPISAASDDLDRRIIGVVVTLGAIGMGFVLLTLDPKSTMTIVVLFIIGGLSFPMYAIGGAYTNDWVSPEHTSAAASQLVTLYGLGAMVGPLIAAPFLDLIGTDGYAWSIIVFHAAVLVFLVYRIRAWHAPLTTKAWHDVSFHGRAFFVPATIVSMGVSGRRSKESESTPS
ncbi:MAG: MFS transporter [Actinobacteria bacterium]|nr:MFS transporter [Actinomycetota bacterium]